MWRLAVFGIGNAIFQTPNNSAVMGGVPKNRLGVASASLNVSFMRAIKEAYIAAGIFSIICAFTSLVRDNIKIQRGD